MSHKQIILKSLAADSQGLRAAAVLAATAPLYYGWFGAPPVFADNLRAANTKN